MKRPATLALVLLVVGLASLAAWYALRTDEVAAPVVDKDQPSIEPMDHQGQILIARTPRPTEFDDIIAELRRPDAGGAEKTDFEIDVEQWDKASGLKFSMRMENPTFKQVVAEANRILEPSGLKVFTYDEAAFPDDFPIGDIVFNDQTVHMLIQLLDRATAQECKHYMTGAGLCLGKEGAIQQAQLDWRAATAEARSRADATLAIMQKEYRPDFDRATLPAVIRQIFDQTGVEVVSDAETWSRPRFLTWRSKPTTLAKALERICREFGTTFRVKDDRVFLIAP